MKKILSIVLTFLGTILYLGAAYSSSEPTTFLGPTLKGGYTDSFSNSTAYSVAGEVGAKNYRVSGTLGWKLQEDQRLKVTGEYLWQRINYNFFLKDTERWVDQGALGAQYEYLFQEYTFKPQLDLSAYYSHAPSQTLNLDMGRIAGSNAGGVAPGVAIQPWQGAKVGVDLNYDRVSYDKRSSPSEDANGFGGTARFNQALTNDVDLGLVAGIRQPFNNYQANLNWTTDSFAGEWVWGLGAAYTVGKNTLPNTYNVVASIEFLMDQKTPSAMEASHHGKMKDDYKDAPVPQPYDDFKKWTSDPAVYMPQVLAITDNSTPPGCGLAVPTSLGPIPNQNFGPPPASFSAAPFFNGQHLVYSMAVTAAFGNPLHVATINSSTGVVSITGPGGVDSEDVVITVTNCAGSVSLPATINLT